MAAVMRSAAAGSGQRTRVASTAARVTAAGSTTPASTCSTCSTQATISTPWARPSHCSTRAPAATRPMVSRALARPPPLAARMPYFCW